MNHWENQPVYKPPKSPFFPHQPLPTSAFFTVARETLYTRRKALGFPQSWRCPGGLLASQVPPVCRHRPAPAETPQIHPSPCSVCWPRNQRTRTTGPLTLGPPGGVRKQGTGKKSEGGREGMGPGFCFLAPFLQVHLGWCVPLLKATAPDGEPVPPADPPVPELICTSIAPSLSCWVCLMLAFLPAAPSAWNVLLGYPGGNSLIPQARPQCLIQKPAPSPIAFLCSTVPQASSPPKPPYR